MGSFRDSLPIGGVDHVSSPRSNVLGFGGFELLNKAGTEPTWLRLAFCFGGQRASTFYVKGLKEGSLQGPWGSFGVL